MIGRRFFWLIFYTFFRLRVQGIENVPSEGGVIIAANHASFFDPPLVGVALSRPAHFMAKAELFDIPVLGWALHRVGVFPVRRDAVDRQAIRSSLTFLRDGRVVVLFPEGTRTSTGEMLQSRRGAAMLASKVGVPIVPVGLVGTFRPIRFRRGLPRFRRFVVRFGKPIYSADFEQAADGTRSGREAVAQLNARVAQEIEALLQG